jgi:hypothetical protein
MTRRPPRRPGSVMTRRRMITAAGLELEHPKRWEVTI